MQFQTLTYLFAFLPFALLGYYILRKTRYANLFMLSISVYFYACSALWYLLPLFFTALLDFFIGQLIFASEDEAYRRRLLIISCVANLGVLAVFKYTTWVTTGLSAWLGTKGVPFSPIVIPLPPAISFYTFQSMSYTIDIKRKEFHPYRNVVDYLSFVCFFPHLVAGPIMRARDLLPQLASIRPVPDAEKLTNALFLILFGVFQKLVLADNLGGMVEFITKSYNFTGGTALPPGIGLIYTYSFSMQIYCDFAAYSTIAIGTARLFNVDLMRNFKTPYLASNPTDFWKRWHISLSTWLRDYLYIPLGGNRHGRWKTLRNLAITMILCGLWHGAGVLFIAWGAWHGLLLVIYRVFPIDTYLERFLGKVGKVLSVVIFYHLVCFGWIMFRTTPQEFMPVVRSILALPGAISKVVIPSFRDVATVLSGSVPFFSSLKSIVVGVSGSFLGSNWVFCVLAWGLVLFSVPVIITDVLGWRHDCEFADLYPRWNMVGKVCISLLLFYCIVFFGRREGTEFIYFAF